MVDRKAREKLRVISFKHRESRRLMLEAIQREKGHEDLSETLREAIDIYIDAHLRAPRDNKEVA